jgi:hypothetical protein
MNIDLTVSEIDTLLTSLDMADGESSDQNLIDAIDAMYIKLVTLKKQAST